MLSMLLTGWRARRVAIIGGRRDTAWTLEAWLTVLGARSVLLEPDADAAAFNRAFTCGRTSAVIVSSPPASAVLLTEIRESGVPLTLLCQGEDAQDAALDALIRGARFFTDRA